MTIVVTTQEIISEAPTVIPKFEIIGISLGQRVQNPTEAVKPERKLGPISSL